MGKPKSQNHAECSLTFTGHEHGIPERLYPCSFRRARSGDDLPDLRQMGQEVEDTDHAEVLEVCQRDCGEGRSALILLL